MLKLHKISDSVFEIVKSNGFNESFSLDTVIPALITMGIDMTEVELALLSMLRNDHNIANFGINGTMIFTDFDPSLLRYNQ